MTITNNFDLPQALVQAVSTQQHNKDGTVSATTLIQGIKQILLTQRHWEELSEDVSKRIWALFGSAVHQLLEKEGADDFSEVSLEFPLSSVTLTGRIDLYDMRKEVIYDYKTASIYKIKNADFEDWYRQGMIYAWLLHKNGFAVKECCFIALLKDYSAAQAMKTGSSLHSPIYQYRFAVTEDRLAEIERFIRQRVTLYEQYRTCADDEIPPCTKHERWASDTVYAIKKQGRKTAVKLFSDVSQATAQLLSLGSLYYLEEREGVSTKCLAYCPCAPFCNFYRSLGIQEKQAA